MLVALLQFLGDWELGVGSCLLKSGPGRDADESRRIVLFLGLGADAES